ncbi:MAG: alkaline phosphatase family protein [Promethearchaeota archaeon]
MSDQDYPIVIAMLLDNVRGTKLVEILERGDLPFIKEYVFDRGTHTTHSMSVFPSSSSNGHTTLTTGCYAGKSGILNAAYWIVPDHGIPTRSKIDEISVKTLKLWDDIIKARTMFEYVPGGNTASFHVIKRGAKIKFFKISKLARYVFLIYRMKRKGVDNVARANTELFRNIMRDQVMKYMKKIGKRPADVPNLNFILFLPSDLAAHFYGYDSPEYLDSLKLADELVEIFVKGFDDKNGRHHPGFEELGMLDRIVWSLFSDHASKPFSQERIFDLVGYLRGKWGKGANVYAFAPVPGAVEDLGNWDVLLLESAEFLGVHFRDPKTRHRVRALPRGELDSFTLVGGLEGRKLLDDFLGPDEVGRVVVRTSLDEFHVISREGEGVVRRENAGPDRRYSYTISEGEDPVGYKGSERSGELVDGQFHSHLDWLAATYDHAVPDLFDHFFGYFDSEFSTPLVLLSKNGAVFWNPDNPKDKPQEKLYQHDGEFAEEKTTPFLMAGPGIKRGGRVSHCRNVDVLPTTLRALGVEVPPGEVDGRVIEEFFEKRD